MASSQLSPKKYIETRARTLPVYKCFVNKDWEEAGEANVIIMRRHVNGNVTTGIYLVDLMCLGIKDTFYFFNEPEAEIYERFPTAIDEMFDEVDYALAHNIIYAGHDFALNYGIEPNKEFAVTRFLLEEDNDNIPLIDIPVGDEDGMPHLMVHQPGEYSSALAKLQKNAGEGNYRYTVSGLTEADFEDDEMDEEEEGSDLLEEYELGQLSPLNVQYISDEELYDNDKTDARIPLERITILTEKALRNLRRAKPAFFDFDEDAEEYELIDESTATAYGVTEADEENFIQIMQAAFSAENNVSADKEDQTEVFVDLLNKYADKLLVVAAVFEHQFSVNGELTDLAKSRLEDLQAYPLAKLDLALANLLSAEPESGFENIYNEQDIRKLFREADSLGDKELATFWLIKTVQHLNDGELSEAIRYYYLYAEVNVINFISTFVQILIFDAIEKALTNGDELDMNESNSDE